MNYVRRISVAAGLAALWLASAAPAPAAAEEFEGGPPHPVWWSPMLELDSLEAIDARLARHIWPGDDEGLPLAKWDGEIREEASAVNCIELERLVAAGFSGISSNDFGLQLLNQALCRGIEALGRAQPAETSYLRDFVLDEEAIHLLPAMAKISPSCDYQCRQRVANERRIPLSRFEPVIQVIVKSEEQIRIRTIDWVSIVTILGRGDFNGDGVDDLLVLINGGSMSGTWGGAELYLLSRDAPSAILFVVEALTGGCDDYQCQAAYDEPRLPSAWSAVRTTTWILSTQMKVRRLSSGGGRCWELNTHRKLTICSHGSFGSSQAARCWKSRARARWWRYPPSPAELSGRCWSAGTA
jgi:hypothetical protein